MADHDDGLRTLSDVGGLDRPSHRGLKAQSRNRLRRGAQTLEPHWLVIAEQRALEVAIGCDLFERSHTVAKIEQVAERDELLGDPGVHRAMFENHQAGGIDAWQWTKQHRLDHGEQRRIGADAERQRQDGSGAKTRFETKQSKRTAEILKKGVGSIYWQQSTPNWGSAIAGPHSLVYVRGKMDPTRFHEPHPPAIDPQGERGQAEPEARQALGAQILERRMKEIALGRAREKAAEAAAELRHRTTAVSPPRGPRAGRTRAHRSTAASHPA